MEKGGVDWRGVGSCQPAGLDFARIVPLGETRVPGMDSSTKLELIVKGWPFELETQLAPGD